MTAPARTAATLRRGMIAGAALWILTALPYVFGQWVTPEGMVFTGVLFNVPDHMQYWAWVTASRQGLFISNTMTPEPNPAVFFNGMAWLLALAQHALNLSFPVLFQLWRAVAFLVLVPAIFLFCRLFARDERERRRALVIALFGAGFGWMLVVAKHATGAADVVWPLDIYIAEANTFWTLLAYPYASFALGGQLTVLIAIWWAHESGRPAAIVVAALGAAFLAFTHAYDLLIVGAVTGLFGLAEWVRHRVFPARLFVTGVAMALASAPLLWYYVRLTSTDPLWRAVLGQYPNAGVWTPPPLHLVVLVGAPLLLAVLELVTHRPRSTADWYIATWAVAGLGLIYLPTAYQVKMLAGWQLPLAILAARGWERHVEPVVKRMLSGLRVLRAHRWQDAVAVLTLLVVIAPTNLYLFLWRFVDLARTQSPYYFTRDEEAALGWLAGHGHPDDVVLAPIAFGRLVPGYSGARSYLAHWAMTNRYFEREADVSRFFAPETPDSWRRALIDEDRVTLVVRTAAPHDTRVYNPADSAAFERVLTLPLVQVFRARPVS